MDGFDCWRGVRVGEGFYSRGWSRCVVLLFMEFEGTAVLSQNKRSIIGR